LLVDLFESYDDARTCERRIIAFKKMKNIERRVEGKVFKTMPKLIKWRCSWKSGFVIILRAPLRQFHYFVF